MIKKITRDPMFLAQKSVDATEADKQVIMDLLDTLRANLNHCVGMAANMIGVSKNIIVVAAEPFQFAMINPVITKKMGTFIQKHAVEGQIARNERGGAVKTPCNRRYACEAATGCGW